MASSSSSSKTANAAGDFDVEAFEQKLTNLKDTQDGIQQMSAWCLQQRIYHKRIVTSWLNVLKQVSVDHRLTLFHLANDVIQYSKRKNYEFVESWGTALQKATTMVRDERVRAKIVRIFKIWEEREIYSEEYLSDLNGLLSMNPARNSQPQTVDPEDFQCTALISSIRECVRLEKGTDKSFKKLPKFPNCDIEVIKNNLKDRSHSDDGEKEINDYTVALETYLKNLKSEIKSRKTLIQSIDVADKFYFIQKGEVKVVVNAYKNFGNRIKLVKKKLDEITPNLPSPIPSPDINAPSPEPDADINLPDESNFAMNIFNNSSNGYSSFMGGSLPFDINDFKRESPKKRSYDTTSISTQPIEVISNRSDDKSDVDDYNLNDFFKSSDAPYTPHDLPLPVPPVSNYSLVQQPTNESYSNNPLGRTGYSTNSSSYGSGYNETAPYTTNANANYNNTQMPLMPPPMPPLLGGASDDFNSTWDMDMSWTSINSNNNTFNSTLDTPVSPPHFEQEGVNPNLIEYVERGISDEIVSNQDVDHRQLHLSGPPIMKIFNKEKGRNVDVDHRNLISLTGSPKPRSFENKRKSNSPIDKDNRLISNKVSKSFQMQSNADVDYRRQSSGDVDYRAQNIQDINRSQYQGRTQVLQELIRERNMSTSSDMTDSTKDRKSAVKEIHLNSSEVPVENFATKTENGNEKLSISVCEKLNPPPPLPSLDAFPNLDVASDYDSNAVFFEGDRNDGKFKKVKDNVESIDMDMSDEDFEDQKRDNSQRLNISMQNNDINLSINPNNNIEELITNNPNNPFKINQRPPLLETPDMSDNSAWLNVQHESENSWDTRVQGSPFRMPPIQLHQNYPRFIQPPRGFNSPLKQNFRDQQYMIGPHRNSSPYFNNRGGGAVGGGGGSGAGGGSGRFSGRNRQKGSYRGQNKWKN